MNRIKTHLSSENIILLGTCKPSGGNTSENIKKLLEENKLDWNKLLLNAKNHCVIPAVYSNLSQIYKDIIPAEQLANFKREYVEIAKKSLYLSSVLIELLKIFENSGIKAITFKGPALSYLLHSDISMRDFSDLDILIRKDDIDCVYDLMESLGYRAQFNLAGHYKTYYENSHYYYMNFTGQKNGVPVDVHWSTNAPNYSFSCNFEYFENRLENIEFLDNTICSLNKEDMLIQLCIHGAKHDWSRLSWLCDMAELCDPVHQLNFFEVIERAGKLKCSGMMLGALNFINTFINNGSITDKSIRNKINGLNKIKLLSPEMVFQSNHERALIMGSGQYFLNAMDSCRDKSLFFYNNYIRPTPLEFSIMGFGTGLFFLYYPLRLLRLLYRVVVRII